MSSIEKRKKYMSYWRRLQITRFLLSQQIRVAVRKTGLDTPVRVQEEAL